MLGLMQGGPLLISGFLMHAAKFHGTQEIVSRMIEGPLHRTTYRELERRARQLASGLIGLGMKPGDRIGTLAWNTFRHMEVWYAVSGSGAVAHTINPRLFPEQIVYIANHAEDRYLFVDLTFLPLVESLIDRLPRLEAVILMTDREHMPATTKVKRLIAYEDLILQGDQDLVWPEFDENTASSLCYTSGTTGNPKGVLYSHRSTTIHSLAANGPDAMGIGAEDCVLPVVPMFHANAWAIPYGVPIAGAKLVFPGLKLDGKSVHDLLELEQVTFTAAVPTVWLALLRHMQENKLGLSTLKRVVIGGSACPRSMIEIFERDYGVEVCHAWGMTEMSPLGTVGALKSGMASLPLEEKLDVKIKQGRAVFGVDMKIVDDGGKDCPHDGRTFGRLKVKGPWIARAYFGEENHEILDKDGYFDTGDVATLDEDGYMQITDRAKDVIKSGGEWISSIDLENLAVGHPDVAEAAAIGVAHEKWDERPLLIIVPKPGRQPTAADILAWFDGKIARWWMPDAVIFVDEIPHTATGKILKTELRARFKDHLLSLGRRVNVPDLVLPALGVAGAALLLAATLGVKLRRVITVRRTALSESERRIQVLTDNLPVVLFQVMVEPRGRFRTLYVSSGIERFLEREIEAGADAIARFRDLVHPSDRPALDAFARRAALRDEPTETTLRIAREDGGSRSIHVLARRRRLPDGQILLDGLLSDVTRQKELETRLRKSATVDDLTGVFNRRYFFERARLEFNRARRFRHPLAVLLIDADHFKQVNDRFGHAIGDRMLAALGHAVRTNLRDIDIVGRLGGEEFGAILPETPIELAANAAERLRRAAADLRVPAAGQEVAITVSIGVVALEQPDDDLEALLVLADAAMYGAKNQGRDRVVIAHADHMGLSG